MDQIFYFDSIFVIDLLGPHEPEQTAQWLMESTLLRAKERDSKLSVFYRSPTNRVELFSALKELKSLAVAGRAPILHIEGHGDENGIDLPDKSRAQWIDFQHALTEINQSCGLNLLVVMAACSGAYMLKTMNPIKRAPCWAVIGPDESVAIGNLRHAMGEFYWHLLQSQNGRAALDAMNESNVVANWRFKLYTAEQMFCWIVQLYVKSMTPENVSVRAREIAAEIARANGYGALQAGILRKKIIEEINDTESLYNRLRRHYLMLDIYPNNASRFEVDYNRCMTFVNPLIDATVRV